LLKCKSQEEIAEAVGVDQKSISDFYQVLGKSLKVVDFPKTEQFSENRTESGENSVLFDTGGDIGLTFRNLSKI